MPEIILADQEHRELSLDTAGSYIVQAPAGSGKTELLTLRYLKLLALCEQPEEVLAITFTRKAASEMRARILKLLRECDEDSSCQSTTALQGLRSEVARSVLARNQELNWRLLENPSRLRVQTIDSFCHFLASQLPILSQVGGNPEISEDIEPCFNYAVDMTLDKLESDSGLADDIALLLQHLDNDRNRIQKLLVSLLYKRDQWLSYVLELGDSPDEAKNYLHSCLDELISETLGAAESASCSYQDQILPLFNYAQSNLAEKNDDPESYRTLNHWPGHSNADLQDWLRIAELLLTKSNTWRLKVDVRAGFPAGKAESTAGQRKQEIQELLAALSADENFLGLLCELRQLPDHDIDTEQWLFLAALLNILADLAKELQLAFRRYGVIDYAQTSAAALAALGSEDEPTDIALALDHKLQHILIDEFQDTSKIQLTLLKQLTAGWQVGDGRTLFLVGDAMQSCYGFRDANVGIYLDVRERGINDFSLTPLTLQANFRSQAKVVDWVNEVFSDAFPAIADSSRGAVPYSHSEATRAALGDADINTTIIAYQEDERDLARLLEADAIVQRIQQLRYSDPKSEIAVLVRSRSHFEPLIPRLRAAGIHWQATDIDRLVSVPIVSDLLSLTRALVNPADRLAWLSVLRAPWCGLDTQGLLTICQLAQENSIYSTLQSEDLDTRLDAANLGRLNAVRSILSYGMAYRTRLSLQRVVEACWRLLRGPECCPTQLELECSGRFFQLLAEHETADSIDNLSRFEEKLTSSFIPSVPQSSASQGQEGDETGKVHLMTMHKAKGLEYDHVLLPALGQKSGGMDAKSLLLWHERLNESGQTRLFLGALTAAGNEDSPLYNYLKAEKAIKEKLESTRLLYIAVTRAIKSVSLFATLPRNDNEGGENNTLSLVDVRDPAKDSLLARIWTQLQERSNGIEVVPCNTGVTEELHPGSKSAGVTQSFPRLRSPIQLDEQEELIVTQRPQTFTQEAEESTAEQAPHSAVEQFSTFDRLASTVGTLIHEALEYYTEHAVTAESVREQLNNYWQHRLERLDLDSDAVNRELEFIANTVQQCIEHPDYAWVFSSSHAESASELSLISKRGSSLHEHKIDRTLVDASGTRWIIDYKTAHPAPGENVADFIASQMNHYAGQLARYRQLFSELEDRPVRTALFLTAIPKLVEYQNADFDSH